MIETIKKTLILIFCCFTVGSCSVRSAPVSVINENEFGGSSFGLSYTNSNKNQTIHNMEEDQLYSPLVTVINHLPTNQTFRIFILLDFKQTKFKKDNVNYQYLDVTLKPNEQKKFNISIPNIPKGKHDFLAISIRSPDFVIPTENKIIMEDQFFMYRRCILFVGTEGKKETEKVTYQQLKTTQTDLQFNSPFITLNTGLKSFKEAVTILNNPQSNFIINYKASHKEQQLFAFILLSSFGQIQTENTFYQLNSLGLTAFPVKSINYPNKSSFNLFAITVSQPYSDASPDTLTMNTVHSSNFISVKRNN